MSEPVAGCELPSHKLPPQFLDSQFLRVHPVFEAMATGKMEFFRRTPIRDVLVEKIFLDRWSFASFVINASKASLGQDAVRDYVKRNPEAAPLINEVDLKQGPEPKDILWSSISRDWNLLDNDTRNDIKDKLKRPTWKLEDPGHPATWPSFKRERVLFVAYWKPRVPEVIMTHTLLSSLPEAKKELYGALHKQLGSDYDHIWDDLVIRGSDQEDRGDLGDLWLSKQPPKEKTVDGHTQWVIVWCVHGQRASPVTSERARDVFVQALLNHGSHEQETNEVYRIQRQTGKELKWLMIHRVVLWEMIWHEQAFKEKLRAQTLAKGGSAPSQVARGVGCTHCGSQDHVAVNCRAAGAHAGKGKGGPTIPKGRGKGSSGSLLPPGCDDWSELKRKAFDSLVSSLAERLTAGHCGWCGSPDHRAPQCPSQKSPSKPGKPKAPAGPQPGAGPPAKPSPNDGGGSSPKPPPQSGDGGGVAREKAKARVMVRARVRARLRVVRGCR